MRALKERVYEANMELYRRNLVIYTWGNVSEIDRDKGIMAIKPSGVPYEKLTADMIVLMDLDSGKVVDSDLNPSSDAPTHLALYRAWSEIGGVTHTHSPCATSWAQAGRGIPAYGTTHGDYFYGEIPCTRKMTPAEIGGDYELETGNVIIETFGGKSPDDIPAVLVHSHGPFTWGTDPHNAVHNAVVLEELAFMAFHTEAITPGKETMQQELLDKHYLRKHGKNAYYGQG